MSLWELHQGVTHVDLTHEIDENSPYWGGMPDGAIELNTTILDFDSPYNLRIQRQTVPGQFGTHIDFPGHFHVDGALAKDFGIDHAVLPLVVIDKHADVAENADYAVSVADIDAYEEQYGAIPTGAFVAFRSDWHKRWPDGGALANADENGALHSPGWSADAVTALHERGVVGIGHETLDTDPAVDCAAAGDLAIERYVLELGLIQVELLANLDQVPVHGALISIGWARIADANGLPVRAWATFRQ
mgnify:FL=1